MGKGLANYDIWATTNFATFRVSLKIIDQKMALLLYFSKLDKIIYIRGFVFQASTRDVTNTFDVSYTTD